MAKPEGLLPGYKGVIVTTPEGIKQRAKVLKELFEEKHKMTFGDRYPYVLKTGKVMTIDTAIGYGELLLNGDITLDTKHQER